MTGELAALVAALNAVLDEDEAAAKAAWGVEWDWRYVAQPFGERPSIAHTVHIARHDPCRVLRDVQAKRDLLAAILAEPHTVIPGDEFYSCSQAADPDPAPGEGGPGSGCSDPDRAGGPCDCGRDARVERLLRILAGVCEPRENDIRFRPEYDAPEPAGTQEGSNDEACG